MLKAVLVTDRFEIIHETLDHCVQDWLHLIFSLFCTLGSIVVNEYRAGCGCLIICCLDLIFGLSGKEPSTAEFHDSTASATESRSDNCGINLKRKFPYS